MDLLVRIGLMRCWAALALLTLALMSESSLREGVMREIVVTFTSIDNIRSLFLPTSLPRDLHKVP